MSNKWFCNFLQRRHSSVERCSAKLTAFAMHGSAAQLISGRIGLTFAFKQLAHTAHTQPPAHKTTAVVLLDLDFSFVFGVSAAEHELCGVAYRGAGPHLTVTLIAQTCAKRESHCYDNIAIIAPSGHHKIMMHRCYVNQAQLAMTSCVQSCVALRKRNVFQRWTIVCASNTHTHICILRNLQRP